MLKELYIQFLYSFQIGYVHRHKVSFKLNIYSSDFVLHLYSLCRNANTHLN